MVMSEYRDIFDVALVGVRHTTLETLLTPSRQIRLPPSRNTRIT